MKVKGFGQAKVLSINELEQLFNWGFTNERDRCLFSLCLHTGCRISEALALTTEDLQEGYITLRKTVTKGKKKTRTIPINERLQSAIDEYLREAQPRFYLFPGHHNAKTSQPLTRSAADLILRQACERIGIKGVSTHSFRRTALTQMHNQGIPLRVIQRISGHSSLATLQRYLEIADEQIIEAVSVIGVRHPKPSSNRGYASEQQSIPF